MADWDADSPPLRDDVRAVLRAVRDQARGRRSVDAELARGWHRRLMEGLDVPDPAWVGRYRGAPGVGVEVRVGARYGVTAGAVHSEVERFVARLGGALEALDRRVRPGELAGPDVLPAVLDLCGWAHAEWVRIHPFANGNGRTARAWANFVAMRYGLPPFVRSRPRPDGAAYGMASARAMAGDWRPTALVMRRLLARFTET